MIFGLLIILFLFSSSPCLAVSHKFATIINPVRGADFWSAPQDTTDFVNIQKLATDKHNAPTTWLLRPDFFLDSNQPIDQFIDYSQRGDEVGIFLETTPTWTESANVDYDQTKPWYFASNVFLSGYNPQDRIKLIDTALAKFHQLFAYYPKTVGAWHIDIYSARYLNQKYNVKVFLICADQLSTDGYQIWGGWWGVPYYPSKQNLLYPAQNIADKLDAVVLWWAARDPTLAYGDNMEASTYSVQANDYLLHDLDENYFAKLADIYLNPYRGQFGQLTIGLENDTPITDQIVYHYQQQISILADQKSSFSTAYQFFQWYRQKFSDISPPHTIADEQSRWIMSTDSRIGLSLSDNQFSVRDYRLYSTPPPDPYFFTKNLTTKLYWHIPAQIDTIVNIGQSQSWQHFQPPTTAAKSKFPLATVFAFVLILIIFLKQNISKQAKIIILIASVLISSTMIKSGINYSFGLGFWGPNGHDAIWHISVINQIKNAIPPANPVFSGYKLINYHWGFDLVVALISKFGQISNLDLYFRLLPFVIALLIGLFSYKLAKSQNKKTSFPLIFVLLNFFAGSFGWIVTLLRSGQIGGESLFWSMQSASTLINPPYALSLVILLGGLTLWIQRRRQNQLLTAVGLGLIFSLLTAVKIYAAILVGLTLSLYYLIQRIKKTANKFDLILPATMAASSLLICFFLGLFSAPSLLQFKPFWFTHSMVESLDKLYLPRLATLRYNLSTQLFSYKLPVFVAIEIFLFIVFLLGNMGLRVLGIKTLYQKIKNKNIGQLDLFAPPFMLLALLIPTLFIQKGTAWNTIQFFYYFLIFANFYLAQFLAKQKSKTVVVVLLLITGITSYSTLKDYFGSPPPASIPQYELQALNFLQQQPPGITLTFPYNKDKKRDLPTPLPLYTYETTAYISALTGHQTFLEDEMNLNITGYNWQSRRQRLEKFFATDTIFQARGLLVNEQISYIYLVNDQFIPYSAQDLQIDKIYDNGQVRIYQTQR